MAHLIETIYDTSVSKAISSLEDTHALIVERTIREQKNIGTNMSMWGAQLKRMEVSLPVGKILIGKSSEKFVEIINILATTERTISALKWLSKTYPGSILRECHASTSDDIGGNDIVLSDNIKNIIVRCEVTDVISSNAAQNGKEKKDLKNLGCSQEVPVDWITRYIATSTEFSNALSSPKRKWKKLHYRYKKHHTNLPCNTVLLEITSKA